MQVEGKYHMKRKEKEDNERMPGILRLTEIPREEPLRTHSKIRNEKRYRLSFMHALHYGNGHHPQQQEHSHEVAAKRFILDSVGRIVFPLYF